jgi:hypothetical protein
VLIKDAVPKGPGWFASMKDDHKVGVVAIIAALLALVLGGACARNCTNAQKEICLEAMRLGQTDVIKATCGEVGR